MDKWLKRTWAEIDLDKLRHNALAIAGKLSPGCSMMAVVKADGYGHGAVEVSRSLADTADWFGVSNLEEAIQLRQAGVTKPVMILGYTPPGEVDRLARHRITQAVLSLDHAQRLSAAAQAAGVTIDIHIKADTGMTRVGLMVQDLKRDCKSIDEIEAICRLPALNSEGIFTHFSCSDEEDDSFTRQQFSRFMELLDALQKRGITFLWKHCCNSAATLRFPEMHLDMVRPGLSLYGLVPSGWMENLLPLRPVMSLKSKISMVKEVQAGAFVSYGRTYETKGPTRLATVSIGYADGYSRRLSSKGVMLVKGQEAPVVGRVCMDACMLDVSHIDNVQTGETVTVFGSDRGQSLPVERFAAWSDTINYEAVCEIGKRVPRLFFKDGKMIGQLNYVI